MYFWAGISWWGKTLGVAWTAADDKVLFRHTKNVCLGTLFEDEGDIFRVVETPGMSKDGKCCYVDHFRFPDVVPPQRFWHQSKISEVKEWHANSRAVIAKREDLQPPTCMQDTTKTL